VADDTLLVNRASQIATEFTSGTIILVSADNRLARVIARTTSLCVAGVNPLIAIKNNLNKEWKDSIVLSANEVFGFDIGIKPFAEAPPVFSETLIDTGNVSSFAQRVEENMNGHGIRTNTFSTINLQRTGVNTLGSRYEVVRKQLLSNNLHYSVMIFYPNGEMRPSSLTPLVEQTRTDSMFQRNIQTAKRFVRLSK